MPFLVKREVTSATTHNTHIDLPPNGYIYAVSVAIRDANNIQNDGTLQILLCNVVADDVTREFNMQSVDLTNEEYGKGQVWTGRIPFGLHEQVRIRVKDCTSGDYIITKVMWDRN